MAIRLKNLADQIIVVTGASSGIGLVTARMAAQRGAKVVLAARNGEALKQVTEELTAQGHDAVYVVADVGKMEDVRRIAASAIEGFGGFDTWVNNAGVSIFGRNEEVPIEDQRRLFDTNFWGVVHGSLVAIEHLKQRGGALINLGSEVSDCAAPLQGAYSASKHAVKAFTDSLRVELEEEGAPISVTLIKPAAIDTMFIAHAKNFLEVEPQLPPPIYAPKVAADAILFAAEHPKRDIFIGSAAKLTSSIAHHMPRLVDQYMKRFMFKLQKTKKLPRNRDDNSLYAPTTDLRERQGAERHVFASSWYTKAAINPKATLLTMLGALAVFTAIRRSRR